MATAGASDSGGVAAHDGDGAHSGWRGWVRWVVIGLALLAAAALIVSVLRGREWAAGEHQRNYRALDLVGRTIDAWPGAIDQMARAALVPSRLEPPPDARMREAGWAAAARFRHPEIGDLAILFRLAGRDCRLLEKKAIEVTPGGRDMRIAGHLDLRDLWIQDQYSLAASGDAPTPTDTDIEQFRWDLATKPGSDKTWITWVAPAGAAVDKPAEKAEPASLRCHMLAYQASLPLDRVASPTVIASDLRAALILNGEGRVLAALGDDVGAVRGWDDFAPDSDEYRQTLRALLTAAAAAQRGAVASGDKTPPVETAESSRAKALASIGTGRPFAAHVGGKRYLVYLRPMAFAGGWSATECLPPGAATGGTSRMSPLGGCMLVGLAAQDVVEQRAISLSSAFIILCALALGLALAMAPAFKLRYLGPAGDMSRLERRLVWIGMVGATGFATAGVLFVAASLAEHGRARLRLEAVSGEMARQFREELRQALTPPPMEELFLDPGGPPASALAVVEPAVRDGIACDIHRGATIAPGKPASPPMARVMLEPGAVASYAWPTVEAWFAMGELGFAYPGSRPIVHRCFAGARASAAGRRYHLRALDGERDGAPPGDWKKIDFPSAQAPRAGLTAPWRSVTPVRGFAADAVRARPDGMTKLAVAVPFSVEGNPEPRPDRGTLLVATTPLSLTRPVLPAGMSFFVVDASQPRLPYRFGDHPQRIDVQNMVDAFAGGVGPESIARALRAGGSAANAGAWGEALPPPVAFTATFEGQRHRFVARPLFGTPFVLLVHQPVERTDARIATTTLYAVYAWMGLALLLVGALFVSSRIGRGTGRHARRHVFDWLWPWAGDAGPARAATRAALATGLAGLSLVAAGWALALPLLAVLAGILAPLAATGLAARALLRARGAAPTGRLLPDDERQHRALGAALVAILGVLPMAGVWVDSALVSRARAEAENARALASGFEANRAALKASLRAMGLDRPVDFASATPVVWTGLPGYVPDARLAGSIASPGLSAMLRDWAGRTEGEFARGCEGVAPAHSPGWFCLDARTRRAGLAVDPGAGFPLWRNQIPALVALALATAGLAGIILYALHRSQIALFGFGVPLNATDYPRIRRWPARDGEARGLLELPPLAVALNGPRALELELRGSNPALDLSYSGKREVGGVEPPLATFAALLKSGGTVVVTGLDVALRDARLRSRALRMLETLAGVRSTADSGRILIVTDLSPLDRILQAFERERRDEDGGGEAERAARQEQLRWSRLFEPFATISLPVVPKFHWTTELSDDEQKALKREGIIESMCVGILLLVEEVRLLPAAVIDSLIDPEREPDAKRWDAASAGGYPLNELELHRLYADKVFRWARSVRPATEKAAVDYLRGMLIEHYQHLWAASSHAERIVLDHLARGRTVNLKAALAMRSLVRRGLVVLDPAPRLMNRSFGAFVKQAERPETVAAYRRQLGKSGWEKAARPLALVGGLAVAGLAGLAVLAGESLTTMLPFVFGAAPALVAALSGARRSA